MRDRLRRRRRGRYLYHGSQELRRVYGRLPDPRRMERGLLMRLATLVFAGLLLIAGKSVPAGPPTPASLVASAWHNLTSLPKGDWPMFNDASGALTFTFPLIGADFNRYGNQIWFGYLFSAARYDLRSYSSYAARYTVTAATGNPVFDFSDQGGAHQCGSTAYVVLFLWDGGKLSNEFGRWWWHPESGFDVLQVGDPVTITADLGDLTRWSSVFGAYASDSPAAAAGFAKVKAAARLGVTFGGGCFFGHGDATKDGTATFRLERIEAR